MESIQTTSFDKLVLQVSLPFCKYCITSKQYRLKFSRSIIRSKCILDLVHSDVWESPDISMRGEKVHSDFH